MAVSIILYPTSAARRKAGTGYQLIWARTSVNVNFGLAKEFSMTERSRLRLGMDGFNFFNHTNLSGLVTSINNRFFGELQNTAGARQIQLNARLIW